MNNHKTRFSDSSVYDEVCINCGATDGRNDDRLNLPCPKPSTPPADVDEDHPLAIFDAGFSSEGGKPPPADVEGSQELLPCPEGEEAEGYNAAIYQQVYDDVIDHATRERLQKLESSPSRRHAKESTWQSQLVHSLVHRIMNLRLMLNTRSLDASGEVEQAIEESGKVGQLMNAADASGYARGLEQAATIGFDVCRELVAASLKPVHQRTLSPSDYWQRAKGAQLVYDRIRALISQHQKGTK